MNMLRRIDTRFIVLVLTLVPLLLGGCCSDLFSPSCGKPKVKLSFIEWDSCGGWPFGGLEAEVNIRNRGNERAYAVWGTLKLIDDCRVIARRTLSFPDLRCGDSAWTEVEFDCIDDESDFDRWEVELHWADEYGNTYSKEYD
ncbi:MAG: hypothetical protein GY835_07665 [bacterium]|nr:hypothetical protein [bacterium]